MNTAYIYRNEMGKIVGHTSDNRFAEAVSTNSQEFVDYQNSINSASISSWDLIKLQRNDLLKESDWTDLPNSPVKNKEAWLTYRQTLRDLPQNFSEPSEVVWPEKPE